MGFSLINHPALGCIPILGNLHISDDYYDISAISSDTVDGQNIQTLQHILLTPGNPNLNVVASWIVCSLVFLFNFGGGGAPPPPPSCVNTSIHRGGVHHPPPQLPTIKGGGVHHPPPPATNDQGGGGPPPPPPARSKFFWGFWRD